MRGPRGSRRGRPQKRTLGSFPLNPNLSPKDRDNDGTGLDEAEGGEVTGARGVPKAEGGGEQFPVIQGERLHRLDLFNEPIALDFDHAHFQLLHVRFSLSRDLAPGGEVDYRGILVGCDDDIDVRELDAKAADRRARAPGSLQKLVPSADRV